MKNYILPICFPNDITTKMEQRGEYPSLALFDVEDVIFYEFSVLYPLFEDQMEVGTRIWVGSVYFDCALPKSEITRIIEEQSSSEIDLTWFALIVIFIEYLFRIFNH